MRRVNIEELKNTGYEEGREILLEAGYIEGDTGTTESDISDYATDMYFTLFDEDDEELHTIGFSQYWNHNEENQEDDILVAERWEEI